MGTRARIKGIREGASLGQQEWYFSSKIGDKGRLLGSVSRIDHRHKQCPQNSLSLPFISDSISMLDSCSQSHSWQRRYNCQQLQVSILYGLYFKEKERPLLPGFRTKSPYWSLQHVSLAHPWTYHCGEVDGGPW